MKNHLNLITEDAKELEKRVFPRFPFNYLIFKTIEHKVFAVRDIGHQGMQLLLKDGEHCYSPGDKLKGSLHWRGAILDLQGQVKWVRGESLGILFDGNRSFDKKVNHFLGVDNLVAEIRPLHREQFALELPNNLKYWLQADGPVEVFIWHHNDGEISCFQILMLGAFIEYKDGKGLKSGQVVDHRDVDTPLVPEDEFLFEMDKTVDQNKLHLAQEIIMRLPDSYLPSETINFVKIKLGLSGT